MLIIHKLRKIQNEKYYFKTTFTAIAALFFATSLYATDMKSNGNVDGKRFHADDKDAMPMQNDKMASDGMMKSHDMKSHDMKMDNMKSEGMKSDDMKTKEMKAKEMKKKAKQWKTENVMLSS